MSYCVKCIVKGHVQGVFYRDTTRQQAHHLNIKGHAVNLLDGSVEVIACGEEHKVKQLQAWLWKGPKQAVVENVICDEIDGEILGGFIVG